MKKIYMITFIFPLVFMSIFFSSCSAPKVKQVGKVFDSYKQISGNLYYDSLSENNLVYEINYNAVGDRECKRYRKNGYSYVYDEKNNEVCILGDIVVSKDDKTTGFTTTTSKPVPTTSTTSITSTTKKNVDKTTNTHPKSTSKHTTKRTTKRTTRYATTYRYVPPVTQKQTTTKKKIFIFDGEKYYIDDNGKWIKIK